MSDTPNESLVRARVDSKTKRESEAMLASMGLTMSEAIRLFLVQTVRQRRLPFAVVAPNAGTRKAIRDSRAGKVKRHADADALFAELDAD
jgi:DNA-damage-inducible protein J